MDYTSLSQPIMQSWNHGNSDTVLTQLGKKYQNAHRDLLVSPSARAENPTGISAFAVAAINLRPAQRGRQFLHILRRELRRIERYYCLSAARHAFNAALG
jgi:hypothetical protein